MIEEIWQELEKAPNPGGGYLRRRIYPESGLDLFIAVELARGGRLIQMGIPGSLAESLGRIPASEAVRVTISGEGAEPCLIELRLVEPRFKDLFTALGEDILQRVLQASGPEAAASALAGRLVRWQRFLASAGEGLGLSARRGLFGELWCLSTILVPCIGPRKAISAWTGPDQADQDFQGGRWAIEVKATHTKQPQRLAIHSERQLDEAGYGALFLLHVSLDERESAGTSLVELVDQARSQAAGDELAAEQLEQQLLAAGYHDVNRGRYGRPCYIVRDVQCFRVEEGFPRILERDLSPGIGDVSYSVLISECQRRAVDIKVLEQMIGERDRGDDGAA